MRLLDLFCGRWGWSRAFAARGWDCIGVDLTIPPEIPERCAFIQADVLSLDVDSIRGMGIDFICASSPCEQFSVHGMKHFHPDPPYPALGIRLFEHTRAICEASGIPYCMENVKRAQDFVGRAVQHCGPYYLWGNSVPLLMVQGITKGVKMGSGSRIKSMSREEKRAYRKQFAALQVGGHSAERAQFTSGWATIPPELANCVADYAERITEGVRE
jgi:hypothetical protein